MVLHRERTFTAHQTIKRAQLTDIEVYAPAEQYKVQLQKDAELSIFNEHLSYLYIRAVPRLCAWATTSELVAGHTWRRVDTRRPSHLQFGRVELKMSLFARKLLCPLGLRDKLQACC
jgi:hypothetical protein